MTIKAEYDIGNWHKAVKISISVEGELKEVTLPNGARLFNKNFAYFINDNGSYAFSVLGRDGISADSVLVSVDNIDNVAPEITFSYDYSDISKVSVNVIDGESGFDKLITPKGEVITSAPYELDGSANQGTFTAYDKAGNKTTKDFMLTSVSIGGSSTHTFVGIDGIPTDWTNKATILRVGAQNTVDGISKIGLDKVGTLSMSSLIEEPESDLEDDLLDLEGVDNQGSDAVMDDEPAIIDDEENPIDDPAIAGDEENPIDNEPAIVGDEENPIDDEPAIVGDDENLIVDDEDSSEGDVITEGDEGLDIPFGGGGVNTNTVIAQSTANENGEYEYIIVTPAGEHRDTFTVDKFDMIAPEINTTIEGGTINYSITDDLSGIKNIYLPNGDIREISSDMQTLINGSITLDGDGEFTIIAEDYAGNMTTHKFNVVEQAVVDPDDNNDPVDPDGDNDPVDPDGDNGSGDPDGDNGSGDPDGDNGSGDPDDESGDNGSNNGSNNDSNNGSNNGSSNNGSNNGNSSSKVRPAVSDQDIKELTDKIPYTLPIGFFNIASHTGKSEASFDDHVIDIIRGRQTVEFKYKGQTIKIELEGIKSESKDSKYSDVKFTHWAKNTIMEATKRGFLVGVADGIYSPASSLNYADTFVAINRVLMENAKLDMANGRTQVDKNSHQLSKEHWAHYSFHSILSKISMSTVEGLTSDGDLIYRKSITRGQLAEVLYQLFKDSSIQENKLIISYKDLQFPGRAIEFCGNTGLMIGDHKKNFNENAYLTRAELASVLIRIDDAINKTK